MTSPTIAPLQRLHEESRTEIIARARAQFQGSNEVFLSLAEEYDAIAPRPRGRFLETFGLSSDDFDSPEGSRLSLAVSSETGGFLRNMALSQRPARILELGSSCGAAPM
ncbi:SAM-dependent methyltransferase, partial [Pseudomonas sp. MWU13-2625]